MYDWEFGEVYPHLAKQILVENPQPSIASWENDLRIDPNPLDKCKNSTYSDITIK